MEENAMTKSLEELQTTHSEMCATAGDLGMEIPAALAIDFTNVEQGAAICKALDAAILKFRAGLDEGGVKADTDGEVSPPETETETDEAPAPKKKKAGKKAVKADKQSLAKGEQKEQGATASKKKVKATKVVGKDPPAAETEKTVAKKAVKKAAPKKGAAKAAKAPAKRAGTLDENAKVTWVGIKGENPYRGDKKERYEKLRKASGKTVKTVIAGGVPSETLRNAVKNKIVTLAA